jgi:hypothetical protein
MNTPVQELYLKLGSFDLTDALKFNTNIIHIEDHFLTPLYLHYIERNVELKKIKRAFESLMFQKRTFDISFSYK